MGDKVSQSGSKQPLAWLGGRQANPIGIDYAEVLQQVQRIGDATEGSTDYDLLAVLVALATAWEADQGKE